MTVFRNATDEELRLIHRTLIDAMGYTRTYGYSDADRAIGLIIGELRTERDARRQRVTA